MTYISDPIAFILLMLAINCCVCDRDNGKGKCGESQWTTARESSRRASKLDEEGMEVAVSRHGFLLKALNMYRGEIFANPLYLQK